MITQDVYKDAAQKVCIVLPCSAKDLKTRKHEAGKIMHKR